tara:strand:+ start:762 stop:1001 length:240 start_codon:yes stop_codon:yes gene_type:complete
MTTTTNNSTNATTTTLLGDYNNCENFIGNGNGYELSIGQEIDYHGITCTIVDFGSGLYEGMIKVRANGDVIFIDESFNA